MSLFKKKNTVLLVDDDKDIRETATMILEGWEFNVIEAKDGKEAIDLAQKKLPDLIILDINIPVINGYEVCKIIKKGIKTGEIPIILLTGMGKTKQVDKGFVSGADDYIIKPVNWDMLKNIISRLLDVEFE